MAVFLPWWEQYPGRLEHERSALQSLGITVQEDSSAKALGIIKWDLVAPDECTGRGDVRLVVTFPEFYPFLRPDVVATDLEMSHHQHPFGKNLCLIGRASAAWDTWNDLAWLIREQLRKAIALGTSEERGGDEENQGEPFSDYYNYTPNAMALIDSEWQPPPGASDGVASLRIAARMPIQADAHSLFIVESIADSEGSSLFSMSEAVSLRYRDWGKCPAQWIHLPAPVMASDAAELWAAVGAIAGAHPNPQNSNGTDFELRLVSFPEEHAQTATGTGWVLVVHQLGKWIQPSKQDRKSRNPARHALRRAPSTYFLIRSGRIGPTDMKARLDTTSSLTSKRVLLVGAGAIGSVVADLLSRAGIKGLTIIDHDVLEPGNLVRHANNLSFVGSHKSVAAAALANQVNPYLDARPLAFPMGTTALGGEQRRILSEEYDKADLIIDATAEIGAQRLSASLARQSGKPWIGAWATNGARGGAVVSLSPSSSWCFSCFEWERNENSRLQPPASPAPLTQPVGCAEPTFVGLGHDLNEVSIHAVRTAIAVLCRRPTHDAAVLSLTHSSGADLPQWDVVTLGKHPACNHR